MTPTPVLTAHVASHVGRVRARQEDAAGCGGWVHQGTSGELVSMTRRAVTSVTCVVADGLGGHAAGDRAARIAAATIASDGHALADRFRSAHERIVDSGRSSGDAGMASTSVAVELSPKQITVANVGDSRAYEITNGLLLISIDDTPERPPGVSATAQTSAVTQVLGGPIAPSVHELKLPVENQVRFLLCSDGLTATVSDPTIEALVIGCPAPGPLTRRLIDAALAAGGVDNVTVAVVEISGGGTDD